MLKYSTSHEKTHRVLTLLLSSFGHTNLAARTYFYPRREKIDSQKDKAKILTSHILLHSTGNHMELLTRKNKNSKERFFSM